MSGTTAGRRRAWTADVTLAMVMLASFGVHAQPQHPAPATQLAEHVEVMRIEITGVRSVRESDVKAVLATRKSSWLPWSDKSYFDPEVFEADLRRIETFYRERGFPRARAQGGVPHRSGGKAVVRIAVDEGEPVRAGEVVFRGFDVLPAEEVEALRRTAALQPAKPVAQIDVQQTARMALTALWNAGYANARVDVLEISLAPNRVRVELHATPGRRRVFGPIEIIGNVSVEDAVIRREITYLPGELFQAAALEESRRRLYRLGLFESVEINVVESPSAAPGVPTSITLKESDHTRFTYSVGYGSEEQLYGEAAFRHLNFLGGARSLSARGRWSWLDRGADGGFVQPYVFGSRAAVSVRTYVWQVDETPYEALSLGGRAGVSYPAGRNTFTAAYIHEHQTVTIPLDVQVDPDARAQVVSFGFDPGTGEQAGPLSAVQFSATRDATVEIGGRTKGYALSARVERAGDWLGGSFDYVNVQGDARYYRSAGPVTLAGRVQYGSIERTGVPAAVPFSKRYFLGGSDSLRGWGRFEVSPLAPSGHPIGGESLFATSGELRLPVIARFSAVAFVDAGNVWEDGWELTRDLHWDAGVGLRYASRVGLLRFDFARQLTRLDGLRIEGEQVVRRWRIHLGLGHTF